MYLLMNKDRMVATVRVEKDPYGSTFVLDECVGQMPLGYETFSNFESWVNERKASKHNGTLKRLMQECGCGNTEGYIRITHACSLNDTFWIKEESEKVSWKDVSFYENEFSDVVSRLAFEGIGLRGERITGTTPEFGTGGSYRKCWQREDGGIFMYKRGLSGFSNAGLEPYGEAMASEIAGLICEKNVRYDLVNFRGQKASKCRLFTDEDIGFVPMSFLPGACASYVETERFFAGLDELERFAEMIVSDALTLNPDRHLNNYGVFVHNDTQKIVGIAPAFDFNLALLPYATKEEFADIGKKLEEIPPQFGNDYTTAAQRMLELCPNLHAKLIPLRDFEFAFRGDETFPAWRVHKLEQMVQTHARAILGKNKKKTIDVFPTKEMLREKRRQRKDDFDR